MPKRGTLLAGGEAGIGKSFNALEYARALSTGSLLYGSAKFKVPEPCRVLYIEQELGEYGLKKRITPILAGEDMELLGKNLFYISKEPSLQLDTDAGVRAVFRAVDEVKPNVVIFDPMGMMITCDENSNPEINAVFLTLEKLKKVNEDRDMSIILIHHFGKPPRNTLTREGFDPLDPYNFRGASSWKDRPDTRQTMCSLGSYLNLGGNRAWKMKTRFLTRHDEQLPDMELSVNHRNDLRVRVMADEIRLPKNYKLKVKERPDPAFQEKMPWQETKEEEMKNA